MYDIYQILDNHKTHIHISKRQPPQTPKNKDLDKKLKEDVGHGFWWNLILNLQLYCPDTDFTLINVSLKFFFLSISISLQIYVLHLKYMVIYVNNFYALNWTIQL